KTIAGFLFDVKVSREFSSLDRLKLRTVNAFNIFFILSLIPTLVIRVMHEEWFIVTLDSITIAGLLLSSLLIHKHYRDLPILLSCVAIPGLGFFLAYTGAIPLAFISPQLSIFFAVFIMVMRTATFRRVYILVYLVSIFLVYAKVNEEVTSSIPLMIQLSGFALVFNYVAAFIQKQNTSLGTALSGLRTMNKDLAVLNKSLLSRNKELKTFSHIMSHDLRAPLRTISGFASLLKRRLDFKEKEHEEYFGLITSSTKEMETLIDDLLLLHKIELDEADYVDTSLDEILEAIKSSYQLEVTAGKLIFDVEDVPVVRGNFVLLKTLFGNLISNAVKYQPWEAEGHIPSVKIYSGKNSVGSEVFIADNGIGIDARYTENIFEPFKRFHTDDAYKGTGLGLSICQRVMEKHGGTIELHQSSEEGTTFKLTFPDVSPATTTSSREVPI
ncbi:MAG: HAMP domain-containing sensor histidine kinase, partial [Bacteroidota bacterium]